ncbi:hypothetical protein AXF42_Ash006771 [Apostasia shenzhenica]|uniref:Uncharacterized protein n=1 Tax=Apostasia shenzhenica TaxID=1088818 RepID=A0A2I0AJ38_9ASPA|nr:hypothetical protein AXF42_Ash006771 [Apostasia shenzhenica]
MCEEREQESPALLIPSSSLLQLPEDEHGRPSDSPKHISAAPDADVGETNEEDNGEFEFKFAVKDSPSSADKISSIGQTRLIYPLFDQNLVAGDCRKGPRKPLQLLLIEQRQEAPASKLSSVLASWDDLEGIPPETYCIWNPPEQCRASGSTENSLRWRIWDLVVRRSRGDGKGKFVRFAADEKRSPEKERSPEKKKGKRERRSSGVAWRRMAI